MPSLIYFKKINVFVLFEFIFVSKNNDISHVLSYNQLLALNKNIYNIFLKEILTVLSYLIFNLYNSSLPYVFVINSLISSKIVFGN